MLFVFMIQKYIVLLLFSFEKICLACPLAAQGNQFPNFALCQRTPNIYHRETLAPLC